jgi:hypothetical protein
MFLAGAALIGRFLCYFALNPDRSGHAQSLVIGVGCIILAFLMTVVAVLADLLSANRRLIEDVLARVRRLDAAAAARAAERGEPIEGVHSTGQPPWRDDEAVSISAVSVPARRAAP